MPILQYDIDIQTERVEPWCSGGMQPLSRHLHSTVENVLLFGIFVQSKNQMINKTRRKLIAVGSVRTNSFQTLTQREAITREKSFLSRLSANAFRLIGQL